MFSRLKMFAPQKIRSHHVMLMFFSIVIGIIFYAEMYLQSEAGIPFSIFSSVLAAVSFYCFFRMYPSIVKTVFWEIQAILYLIAVWMIQFFILPMLQSFFQPPSIPMYQSIGVTVAVFFFFILLFNLIWILHQDFAKNTRFIGLFKSLTCYGIIARVVPESKRKPSALHKTLFIISCVLFFCSLALFMFTRVLTTKFAFMQFEAILFTIKYAGEGTPAGTISMIVKKIIEAAIIFVLYFVYTFRLLRYKEKTVYSLNKKCSFIGVISPDHTVVILLLQIVFLACVSGFFSQSLGFGEYMKNITSPTTIYEDYYIRPENDALVFPEKKKNLVYLYLEAIESTFSSTENGGCNPTDYIPELAELAFQNVSFSHNNKLGGQSVFCPNLSYTMGSTVAQTSGLLLVSPMGENDSTAKTFLPGVVTLEDILHDNGYNQMFMIGSDSDFAGYGKYVKRYDDSVLYEYSSAEDEGYSSDNKTGKWGLQDITLYQIAKEKILELASEDEPFAISISTIDTHGFEYGFPCELCDKSIEDQYLSAIRCASKQASDFVQWLSEQDFFADTVIIMNGDHLTPAQIPPESYSIPDSYVRANYNCFINAQKEPVSFQNRIFTAMDMFPTTLSALGVTIEGDRLGLGTDLFSETPTLCEELGADYFIQELQKHSDYYFETFWG